MGHSIRACQAAEAAADAAPAAGGDAQKGAAQWEDRFRRTGAFGGAVGLAVPLLGEPAESRGAGTAAGRHTAEQVISWLASNRLQARIEDAVITVMGGVAFIDYPYSPQACRSSNEIVLARVQQLLRSMPG